MSAASIVIDTRNPNAALRNYYFLRAVVAFVWVAAAFTLGASNPLIGAVLLVVYPAWDALANLLDARANGGYRVNRTQMVNAAVSVFGVWAVLAGMLQLLTGVRRWRTYGAQWAMVLSGGQSVLAGVFFVLMAAKPTALSITSVAGYAGFGAFYFLVSALWLTFRKSGNRR
jgi:hypothetical protein